MSSTSNLNLQYEQQLFEMTKSLDDTIYECKSKLQNAIDILLQDHQTQITKRLQQYHEKQGTLIESYFQKELLEEVTKKQENAKLLEQQKMNLEQNLEQFKQFNEEIKKKGSELFEQAQNNSQISEIILKNNKQLEELKIENESLQIKENQVKQLIDVYQHCSGIQMSLDQKNKIIILNIMPNKKLTLQIEDQKFKVIEIIPASYDISQFEDKSFFEIIAQSL